MIKSNNNKFNKYKTKKKFNRIQFNKIQIIANFNRINKNVIIKLIWLNKIKNLKANLRNQQNKWMIFYSKKKNKNTENTLIHNKGKMKK